MKKLTAILLITTTFLTACGTDGSSDTGKETTTQGQTIEETQEKTLPEAIENVDTSIEYDSMDIFLSSDFGDPSLRHRRRISSRHTAE